MELGTILEKFKQCFAQIPKNDTRAKIGPREFVTSLIFCFLKDRGSRSLETLRRGIIAATGETLCRSSFWQRISSKRTFSLLLSLVEDCLQQVNKFSFKNMPLNSLLTLLDVTGILVLDSTSISLIDMAGGIFPGTRKNVAPAAIKWHNCFDLFGGALKWFDLSPGTSNDHNHFPDFAMLTGKLIIFDLGYWNYTLLDAIGEARGFYLSRITINAKVKIIEVVRGLPSTYLDSTLFKKRLPKHKKIIEVVGVLGQEKHLISRVIGFWNPIERTYHWYTTNLNVSAKLIYPLYRLRWQVELLFKTAKSCINLSDIPSADPNIIQSLVLASVVVMTMAHPLAFTIAKLNEKENGLYLPSLQRAGAIFVQVGAELKNFLLSKTKDSLFVLKKKLILFIKEFFDPNKKRETSMQRAFRVAGLKA